MHIVPAPAESLMKSRVLSIPGLQGVKDETWDGYRLFRLSGGARATPPDAMVVSGLNSWWVLRVQTVRDNQGRVVSVSARYPRPSALHPTLHHALGS